MATKQIGWFTLKEDKVFCDNGYECAAWYENILVPAGKYPINVVDYTVMHFDDERRKRYNGRVKGHIDSAYITMDGTIVSDDFGSRFYGMPIGDYDIYQNKGKPSRYTMQMYLYSLADSVLHDPDSPYELLPEYEAREVYFEYDGEQHKTHEIRVKGVE